MSMAVEEGSKLISRIGYMTGGKSARWRDEEIADRITQHAIDFIKNNREKPFFLYFATHDIHVPRVPHPRFRGATKMGPRGDAIAEFDWSAGQVLKALDEFCHAFQTLLGCCLGCEPVFRLVSDSWEQLKRRFGLVATITIATDVMALQTIQNMSKVICVGSVAECFVLEPERFASNL